MSAFNGANLRLARLFNALSLAELGERVGVSKQFLSRLENGAESVPTQLEDSLAIQLGVVPDFFHHADAFPIADEQCHFRRQLTTKVVLRQVARARGEILKRFVSVIDEHVELPAYQFSEEDPSSIESIERAAEVFRARFSLGSGPISNITRVAENAGAVVIRVGGMADEIDAVSFATKRPLIALNNGTNSACRERFGVAHELGHFALHIGILTGDRLTESQANRFASALLMPRATFSSECRMATRGLRLNWQGISQLKMRWGVSKAAILFRGHQLGVLTDAQMRSGYIGLNRHGEAIEESEDRLIQKEEPEVVADSLKVMEEHFGMSLSEIARVMRVQDGTLRSLLAIEAPVKESNVVSMLGRSKLNAMLSVFLLMPLLLAGVPGTLI